MDLTSRNVNAHTAINTEIHHCHPLVPTLRRYWGLRYEIHCYSFAKIPDPKYLTLRLPPTSQYTYIDRTTQLCDRWQKNFGDDSLRPAVTAALSEELNQGDSGFLHNLRI